MAIRTIRPIHIGLPDVEDGYYRFDELPALIAVSLYPDQEESDSGFVTDYDMFRHFCMEGYRQDLMSAAELAQGHPGYLHVVENGPSKRPLTWHSGHPLNSGLVHLDWLNEWGESRTPQVVFSTLKAAPAPVVPPTETKEERQGRRLQACIDAGLPMDSKAALSRLPDGVGDVAELEGIKRQTFSADVKAALKRREAAKREGATVHRA